MRRSASEVKPCSLIFHLLRMVVQYFILRGRSNKLMIFKSRRMRLYSSLKLQKRKKRIGSALGKGPRRGVKQICAYNSLTFYSNPDAARLCVYKHIVFANKAGFKLKH
jgi:hypothetical protein